MIRTNDDVHLIIPNSKFISETVTNRSYGSPRVRYRIPVGVAYGSNPREVEQALLEAARRIDDVLTDPPPTVRFRGFGETSLDFELQCWTSTMLHKQGAFRSELNFAIHEALKKHGIEVPSPSPRRDVHIRSAEGFERLLERREAFEPAAWKLHRDQSEEDR